MKVRRRSLIVPVLAILGILLALFLLSRRKTAEPLPTEIPVNVTPVPAPKPAAHALPPSAAPESEARHATPAPAAAAPAPSDADYHMSVETEMKVALAAIYSAEKSFYSEYHRYSTDLNAIGYAPELNLPLRTKVGFLHEYVPPDPLPTERPGHMTISTAEIKDEHLKFTPAAQAARFEDVAHYCHQDCTANDSRFEIAVITTVNGKPDVWILNQDKIMTHESAVEAR